MRHALVLLISDYSDYFFCGLIIINKIKQWNQQNRTVKKIDKNSSVSKVRQRQSIIHVSARIRSVKSGTGTTDTLNSRSQQGKCNRATKPVHCGTVGCIPLFSQQRGEAFIEHRSLFAHACLQ